MVTDAANQLTRAMAGVLGRVLDAGLAEHEAVVTVEELAAALVADLAGTDADRRRAARGAVLAWCVTPADPAVTVDPGPWWDTPLGALVRAAGAD